jgi:hypothetical protein
VDGIKLGSINNVGFALDFWKSIKKEAIMLLITYNMD